MPLQSFTIKPWLGIKSNTPSNDPALLQPVGDTVALAHCVDGSNIDFQRIRNSCTKSLGYAQWSNTACAGGVKCLGLFRLVDGSETARFYFDGTASGGRVFKYDGARDPSRICDTAICGGTPVEFANSDMDLYSIIRVGPYMVFSDYGEHTPYCCDWNDTTLQKLFDSGTEYQAKYLAYFGNRIVMANVTSGITVGDISVIWTNINPTPASSCNVGTGDPPANHLYKPDDDTITGLKLMGRNSLYLYGENSIDSIDYYPSYSLPFSIRSVVTGQGAYNSGSIVTVGGSHYLFNRNYGFCIFDGSSNFPSGGRPISEPIENIISGININYGGWIKGTFIPLTNEIVWTVPLDGADRPTHLLFWHIYDKTWRIEEKVAYFVDTQQIITDLAWEDLSALGYNTWSDLGLLRWADLVQTAERLVWGNNNGQLYYHGTESNAGAAMDGYRVEPILDFGRPNDKDLLLEIWFDFVQSGDYSLYCYHRGGNTPSECNSATWNALTELSYADPANALFRLAETARFHQIKWGTDGANEPFSINSIEFRYVPQGRY